MTYFLSVLLMAFALSSNAEEIFPPHCVPLLVANELLTLPAATKTVVMIHNLSNTDLWITHAAQDSGVSAGWSSRLQAGYWSALAFNGKAFELSCIESKPGHEQQIPCSGVLAVCQWTHVKMPPKTSGIFWAGENRLLSPLKAYIERRGFVLSEQLSHNQGTVEDGDS